MTQLDTISVQDFARRVSEKAAETILDSFRCVKNPHIETFVRNSAMGFSKQGISMAAVLTSC